MSQQSQQDAKSFRFTGWHMLGSMLLFFGTIISVNMFMAWNAVSSWSGLVVPNTYVASQQFNGKAEAAKKRAATGITGTLSVEPNHVRFLVRNPHDSNYQPDSVSLKFRRPVGEAQNFDLILATTGNGQFEAKHDVPAGQWIVESVATKDGEVIIHEGERISVRQPAS